MSFEALIEKVKQAEGALEASERQTAANWRQLKASWLAAWTPGRIVSVGLVSGFLVGRAEPARRVVRGGGVLQMLGTLGGLFASGSAQVAAAHAEEAADGAQQTAATVDPGAALAGGVVGGDGNGAAGSVRSSSMHTPESLRAAGLL